MRVVHITNDIAAASGVGTFVRRINAELRTLGVNSVVLSKVEELEKLSHEIRAKSDGLIFHIHGLWLDIHRLAMQIARARSIPVVWSTHGMTAPWSMHHKWWKKFPAWWLYQRRDLRGAAAIHCTTELEAGWNRRLGLRSTFVVPLGTDLPELMPAVGDVGLASEVKTLLFVGRIYPVKALDRLIRAFALAIRAQGASASNCNWRLRLVGPDQAGHRAELMALCDRLQLASRVEFAGPRYGAELETEYARCTALALVSHTENFGATVADALARTKPVITSTATPWQIVAERGCGWWVDNTPEILAVAIGELMTASAAERLAMGVRGRQLVAERFAWSAVAKSIIAEYDHLLKIWG